MSDDIAVKIIERQATEIVNLQNTEAKLRASLKIASEADIRQIAEIDRITQENVAAWNSAEHNAKRSRRLLEALKLIAAYGCVFLRDSTCKECCVPHDKWCGECLAKEALEADNG